MLTANRLLSRPAPSVFRDLALLMIGLGLCVGVAFPFFVLALDVPASKALRPGFWTATIGAGLFVGLVNFVIARNVFVLRLRPLTARMHTVQKALDLAVTSGDLSQCEPASCHLPVDSADELGTVATAFNLLLDAVSRAHTVEHAVADMVTTVARARNERSLCATALDRLLSHCRASGGAIGILHDGTEYACAQQGMPEHLDIAALAHDSGDGFHQVSYPDGIVSVVPIQVSSVVTGVVALASTTPVDPTSRRLMALLADSLGVALEALRLQEQLANTAVHDALTGLANRRLFLDRAHGALMRAQHTGSQLAVVAIDLDDFKTINDSLGHAAGDQLLIAVAGRLRAAVRDEDTPARFGGDEFAILIEKPDGPVGITAVLERLLSRLHEPFELEGRTIRTTASIGLATATATATADSLLRDADAAMYTAKRSGKGRAQIFDPSLQAIADRALNIKIDLAGALDRDELTMVYQPIVDLRTGALVGLEALLRWTCGEHGSVPPDEFIPIAEATGLIHSIGRWVLREACAQAQAWQQRFPTHPPYVTVNLSAVQMHDDQMADIVLDALATSGLPPELLAVELTESVLVLNAERVLNHMHKLRSRGVRIALDDFGTGYSSLSYLDRFPFDLIKLDKTFIDPLGSDNGLCAGVLQLTRTLGLTTIAEGVERHDQARQLSALNCDLVQGYLYSPPLPAAQVDDLLRSPGLAHQYAQLSSRQAPAEAAGTAPTPRPGTATNPQPGEPASDVPTVQPVVFV